MNQRYNPKDDPQFQKPYVDKETWREETGVRCYHVHGGFEDTDLRFSFFYPTKDSYQGRFFHFLAPAPSHEDASIGVKGVENKIAFAVTHGAYFVETNMGVLSPFSPMEDSTIIYRASAAAAEFSRHIAVRLFGDHRPYGYVYGGSGGGYKSTSCFENTNAWDGALPYIIGSPMAIPNVFCVRALAKRVLRHKLPLIADAMEPGGDPNFKEKLTHEEREVWEEVVQMGFPTRSWFFHDRMDDGALPVLVPGVERIDGSYYKDFWTLPGYAGTDMDSSAVRDRIQHTTSVLDLHLPGQSPTTVSDAHQTGADDAWKRNRGDKGLTERPLVRLRDVPAGDPYLYGARLVLLSGEAAGSSLPLESLDENTAVIGAGFGQHDILEILARIKPGDRLLLDNSDYIAMQYYHRHQVPDHSYATWNQYRGKDGKPLYPQRPLLVGPIISQGGAGSLQSGCFEGKMIVLATLMDESAFPWQADWYRRLVREQQGEREQTAFRLWYIDHALHDDRDMTIDPLHLISYAGALRQGLLDLAAWVEKGIEPAASSVYQIQDGQVLVPPNAVQRMGVQPAVQLKVNGADSTTVATGETAYFYADVQMPKGQGQLIRCAWSFEGDADFPVQGAFATMSDDGEKGTVEGMYSFPAAGTYFPVLKVWAQRHGDADQVFTLNTNLCRVRVNVHDANSKEKEKTL